ncbi:uncharacterized protein G2W53_014456 [Senna tora]|uniref:Uncharacterized protein n=1 Tax=Senna tora TaxID=362788 RepID=A0A834WTL1_9FABA|nr:uncharacterized protein G2W53_014456 [Senna tora]
MSWHNCNCTRTGVIAPRHCPGTPGARKMYFRAPESFLNDP